MAFYRIFTNDRGKKGGVPMYSALMEVTASSPEAAVKKVPIALGRLAVDPPMAVHWPPSEQSDDEKAWLKKHVG